MPLLSHHSIPLAPRARKKATLPARDAGKVTLRPKNRYILNAWPAPSLEPSLSAAAFDVIHPRQRPLPKEELAFLQVIREAVEQSPLEPGCAAARAMMKIDDED